jgi:hypothetical protein
MRVISSAILAIWLVCLSHKSSEAVELEPLDKYLSKHSLDDPRSAGYVALRSSVLGSEIRKYYVFAGQFDVQLFENSMTFIENNGRGSIAMGKCSLRQ